jgi:hypothetical protein
VNAGGDDRERIAEIVSHDGGDAPALFDLVPEGIRERELMRAHLELLVESRGVLGEHLSLADQVSHVLDAVNQRARRSRGRSTSSPELPPGWSAW